MKILNLYFKNINSLEGENFIDFQKKPLLNAGIFAIIGPNGSGKSSILDVISLAFYGETFRFDRPSEHVITQHTTDSFAQVEFSLANKKFKSRWQIKRQNNHSSGELLEPTMLLFTLNGNNEELIAESLQTVSAKISDIIGMDFHNFSRSIMLAQGDFAAFLNALDNERMDILEKMNRGDIYEQHKQQLKTKKQQSQQTLEQIKNDLKTLPIMNKIEAETCEDDLISFQEQLDEYKQQQHEFKQQLAWHQQIKYLQQQRSDLDNKEILINEHIEQIQKKLQKITSIAKVIIFKEDVNLIDKQQQQFNHYQTTLNNAQYELEQLQEKQKQFNTPTNTPSVKGKKNADQKQLIDNLRYQVKQKNVVLKTEISSIVLINEEIATIKNQKIEALTWLNAHSCDKSLLNSFPETQKLRQLNLNLATLVLEYNAVEEQCTIAQQSLETIENNENLDAEKIIATQQSLVEEEHRLETMIAAMPLIERQQMVKEQQQRINDFNKLYTLATANHRLTKPNFLSWFGSKKANERLTIKELEQKADELARQISEAQFLRNTLEKAITNEHLLKEIHQYREFLEKGKSCLLCGATEHPFVKNPPRKTGSEHALKDQNLKLQLLVVNADKIKKQIINAKNDDEIEEKKAHNLQKNRSQWRVLSNKLNISSKKLDMENFSLMKQLLKQEHNELNQFQQHLNLFQQQQLLVEKLKKQLMIEKESAITLKTKREQLQSEVEQLPKTLAILKPQLEQARIDETVLTDKTMQQLAELGEKMPPKNKDINLVERLKIRQQNYQVYLEREQLATKKLTQLDGKLKEIQQKIEQLKSDISQKTQALTTEESTRLYLAQLEKQKIIVDKKQLFQQQQQQLHQLEQALKDKLHQSQFSDLAELKSALVLIAEHEEVEQKHASLQQESAYLKTEQQQQQAKLTTVQSLKISPYSIEILEEKNKALSQKISISHDEISYLKNKQHKQVTIQQQQQLLSEKLAQQQQHFSESESNLHDSEENGIVFRRRVQLNMATQLLSQANKILEKISGRYYIRQASSDTGLALEIEDSKQQNSRRLPKSLSGGESFIVSLALALALSELANNGKAVNSLFLDEGFGNLDSETLYIVVSTLQRLQLQGKTIGVISHIDGVRKRIKTRIQMVKKPNGLSQLKKIS